MARNPKLEYSCKHSVKVDHPENPSEEILGYMKDALEEWQSWKGKIVAKSGGYTQSLEVGIIKEVTGKMANGYYKPHVTMTWFKNKDKPIKKTCSLSTLYDVKAFIRSGSNQYWYESRDDKKLLKVIDDYFNGV